ncbi:hypothetical protein TYRP_022610, partial [Tyrophagus putrescentiae]
NVFAQQSDCTCILQQCTAQICKDLRVKRAGPEVTKVNSGQVTSEACKTTEKLFLLKVLRVINDPPQYVIPYLRTFYKYFTNKPQMLKAGVIWLIGTDGLGHNELASCVPSRRTMPINQMTSVNA